MKISCDECKNYNSLNCIDTAEISCRLGNKIVYERHECKDGNRINILASEEYRRGYLHGYNQCRNDALKSVDNCMPNIPKIMKNL